MGNILNIINSDKHFYDKNKHWYMECMKGAFWTDEFKKFLRFKLVDVEQIQPNEKYIYLVECRHDNGIYGGLLKIPTKVIDLVNEGRCKVIFSFEAEGNLNVIQFNDWFFLNCKSYEESIDFSKFYIFTSDLNCVKNNKTKINFFDSNHHFDVISNDFYITYSQGRTWEIADFNYDFIYHSVSDVDIENKNKYFLSYIRNTMREHRKNLAAYFQHNGLWEENNLSFLKSGYSSSNGHHDYLPHKYHKSFIELDNLPIQELDTHHLEDKQSFNTSLSHDWKHYQETFLSIVSETLYDNNQNLFISEKICKPIFNLHPFIVMGTPYFLKKLQEFGFKTFHPFIDESYDLETNHLKRTEMIFEELDKFRSKSFDELKEWWKEILPILEHNQNVFLKFGQSKTRKMKLLEKLYD